MSDKQTATQKGYLVTNGKNIQLLHNLSEVAALEFDKVEEAENLTIFEIEFKKKIEFKAKVKLNISG